jgi:hypothetical protein
VYRLPVQGALCAAKYRQTWQNMKTTEPVQPGNFSGISPEFGRVADVTRMFGIKRGTLYNLLRDGKIRAVLLRVRGARSGVRLFDMASIRTFILSQFNSNVESAK